MAVDFELTDEQRDLSARLRHFAETELRPYARAFEARRSWSARVTHMLDDLELRALDIPRDLGGVGAGMLAKVIALEAVAWGDAGGLPAADLGPAAAALLACPDAEVAREVADACLAHEASAHLAIRTGDEASGPVRIPWAAGSVPAGWIWLTRREELVLFEMGETPVGHIEAGAFDASSGVSLAQPSTLPAGRWTLDPEAALELRGRARLWPAAVAVGVAAASFEDTLELAQQRGEAHAGEEHRGGSALALAEGAARLEGARLAVRMAAARLDAGTPWAGGWASLAHLEAMEMAPWVCDLCVQFLGGHGYVQDHPAEKRFREARMLSLLWGGRAYAFADAEALARAPDPLLE